MDPLKLDLVVTKCATKPLFMAFAHISTKYTFPGVYFFYSVYQHFYVHQVLRALDSDCFRQFYHCKKQARRIFVLITCINHASFLAILFERHRIHRLTEWPSVQHWLGYFAMYVVFQYVYWLCMVLHYYQYATYRLLVQIQARITANRSSISMKQALEEIQLLATANQHLSQLLSPGFIMYFVFVLFNMTRIVCFALVCEPNFRLLLQLSSTCAYTIFIVWLNSKICRTLNHIFAKLKSDRAQRCREALGDKRRKICGPISQNHSIHFFDIEVYAQCFLIKVFLLGTIDFRLLLQTVLFILVYVVFFTQTN